MLVFFFKQKTSYEVRIRDWSSDVCSSDLAFRSLTKRLWNGPAGHRLNTAEPEGGELAGQDVVRMSGKGLPPVLDTAGPQADPIATLSWVLIVGGGVILLIILVALGIALFGGAWRRDRKSTRLNSSH